MIIVSDVLPSFQRHLHHHEASPHTIAKYLRDVRLLARITGNRIESLDQMLAYKKELQQRGYAVQSINSMLSAVNQFVCFCGHPEWKLRVLKWQHPIFADEKREIRQQEYHLCAKLLDYSARRGIRTGCFFITRSGRVVDRSNIWRQMKRLHAAARVRREKVFPHNLRHLFACCFYQKFKDVVRLADILGHSSVDTTRIYTAKSTAGERRRMELLGLVVGQQKRLHNQYYVVETGRQKVCQILFF